MHPKYPTHVDLTVAMITHAENPWFFASISSLILQSVTPDTLFIMDNGVGAYRDEWTEVAEICKRRGITFRLESLARPVPLSFARKHCHFACRTKWILFADDDQVYHGAFLEHAWENCVASSNSKRAVYKYAGFFGTQVQLYDVGRFAAVAQPFSVISEGYKRAEAEASGIGISGFKPIVPDEILKGLYTFGGTIVFCNNIPETLYAWAEKAPDLGEDQLMVLSWLARGEQIAYDPRMIAYHLRKKPALYQGGKQLVAKVWQEMEKA